MKPVEQMFPSVEGYTNAIPSKHDVAAFMRIVQVFGEKNLLLYTPITKDDGGLDEYPVHFFLLRF